MSTALDSLRWGRPLASRKYHVFDRGSRSLCGKWLYGSANTPVEPGDETSIRTDDCKACVSRLKALVPKGGAA